MRNQSWLPDGTLVTDEEFNLVAGVWQYLNLITGEIRPATPDEIESLPDPEILMAEELLATSPQVITMPEIWELMRIFGKLHGFTI